MPPRSDKGPSLPLAARRAPPAPIAELPAAPQPAPRAPDACSGCDGSGNNRLGKFDYKCMTCRGHGTLELRDGRWRARTS